MSRVYQSGPQKRWCIDFVDASGRRIRRKTDAQTRTEAKRLLQAKLSENAKAAILGVSSVDGVRVTLKQFLGDTYLPHVRANLRPRTVSNYEVFATRISSKLGNLPLRSLGRTEIQQYMDDRIREGKARNGRPLAKASINREMAFFKAALYEALRRGLIDRNPCARMRLLHEENTRTRVLTEIEEIRLFRHCEAWLTPILKTAMLAGLRLGEILSLKWEDVDTDRKLVFVSHESKSHKRRELPLLPELESVLTSLTKVIGKDGLLPHIFTSPKTEERYKLHDVENAFKRATKAARIKDLRFHDLRRTFASRLAQRGVSLQAIAKLLGHGATYVTERYVSFSFDDLRAAMDKLSNSASAGEVGKNPAISASRHTAGG